MSWGSNIFDLFLHDPLWFFRKPIGGPPTFPKTWD
jgi:hypothetical protein